MSLGNFGAALSRTRKLAVFLMGLSSLLIMITLGVLKLTNESMANAPDIETESKADFGDGGTAEDEPNAMEERPNHDTGRATSITKDPDAIDEAIARTNAGLFDRGDPLLTKKQECLVRAAAGNGNPAACDKVE